MVIIFKDPGQGHVNQMVHGLVSNLSVIVSNGLWFPIRLNVLNDLDHWRYKQHTNTRVRGFQSDNYENCAIFSKSLFFV